MFIDINTNSINNKTEIFRRNINRKKSKTKVYIFAILGYQYQSDKFKVKIKVLNIPRLSCRSRSVTSFNEVSSYLKMICLAIIS